MFLKKKDTYVSQPLGLPDLLPYSRLVDEGAMELKSGALMTGFIYNGPDIQSASQRVLNEMAAQANSAVTKQGGGWTYHVTQVASQMSAYPYSSFPNPVLALIDKLRNFSNTLEGTRYQRLYVCTLTWMPPSASEGALVKLLAEGSAAEARNALRNAEDRNRQQFEQQVQQFMNTFQRIGGGSTPSTSMRVARLSPEELLTHLNFCVTGKVARVRVPMPAVDIDYLIGHESLVTGTHPMIGSKHLRVLAIDGFPSFTEPAILQGLATLGATFRWTSRFTTFTEQEWAKLSGSAHKEWSKAAVPLKEWIRQARGMETGERKKLEQERAAEVEQAQDLVRRGELKMGRFCSNLVLMHSSEAELELLTASLVKRIEDAGFPVRVETDNAVEAYLSSLPGEVAANVRQPVVSSMNFVHTLPLNGVWLGNEFSTNELMPKKSPPLMVGLSQGAVPFRVNLHVGTLGHTAVVGPTGSGKSTLLALMVAQFFRYEGARAFVFDKGNSMLATAAAGGGACFDLGDEKSRIRLSPLARIDSPLERDWAAGWIERMLMLNSTEAKFEPAVRRAIESGLETLANYPADMRSVSGFLGTVQSPWPDKPDWFRERLKGYTSGESLVGTMLDGTEEVLNDSRFVLFELDELMTLPDGMVLPVLDYLFHHIERTLKEGNAEPTLIVLDEAWALFKHPFFLARIQEWLRTLRRKNAAVVLATQNVEDLIGSEFGAVLINATATKIWLRNPNADSDLFREFYRKAGNLLPEQVSLLAEAPKHHYMMSNELGTRLFHLSLDETALAFVGASSREEIARVKALMRSGDSQWPVRWLESKGLQDAADYLREMYAEEGPWDNVPRGMGV